MRSLTKEPITETLSRRNFVVGVAACGLVSLIPEAKATTQYDLVFDIESKYLAKRRLDIVEIKVREALADRLNTQVKLVMPTRKFWDRIQPVIDNFNGTTTNQMVRIRLLSDVATWNKNVSLTTEVLSA